MGHRMLLNIYDTEKLFLPRNPTPEKWLDYEQFYGSTNRFLGDLIRPYLESHVFDFVAAEAAAKHNGSAEVTVPELVDKSRQLVSERLARSAELHDVVSGSASRDGMIEMLAIQTVGASLNAG